MSERAAHAFERMVNRIERALLGWDSHAVLFCDEGKETEITRLIRRMGVFNPIPSQFGGWSGTGARSKNIPLERIVEDPVFKKSDQSYFIQLVDFAAFSLLRRERPTARLQRYGLDKAFEKLHPILVTAATRHDPEGILRP